MPSGSLLEIRLSAGGKILVPDVRGLSVEEARAVLIEAGFASAEVPQDSQGQYVVNDPAIPVGKVVRTLPEAGSMADAGGAILLVISG